jgi:flagellar hook-basal body complex protein FliE
MPIDPTFAVNGLDWQVGSVDAGVPGQAGGLAGAGTSGEGGFGGMLAQQVSKLSEMQSDAATAPQELAAGTATDTSSAVMAIERARLSMQLASQIRTKGVEALTEVLRSQV